MKEYKFANNCYKGFTLIELLAIIVILAIIAVITVPLILGIIDESKQKAAINSAYGYREAINQHYYSRIFTNPDYKIQDGEYEISEYKSDGLIVSGEYPSDGWVKIENGKITDFSFIIGEYAVTFDSSTNTITVIKGGELTLTPTIQEKKNAKIAALAIVSEESGTTGITDITEGWVAFIDGTLKAYSVHVTINSKDYIVTDNNVEYQNNTIIYNNAVANEGTTVAEKTETEELIVDYYGELAETDVSNYISALLTNSTIQGYVGDTSKKVFEISSPSAPTGTDTNSWIYFKKETSSVTIPDYSIKITKGGYSFVINNVSGTVSGPIYNSSLLEQIVPIPSFATDSWATIKANLINDRSTYEIGDTKEVVIDNISYTVRLANTSSCPNDWPQAASQTTCGVVIEFVDTIIDTGNNNNTDGHAMNSTNTNVGGWPNSSMRDYLNTTIFNKLPNELKAEGMILNTQVVSGHERDVSTNYTSPDKLYLLSYVEIWGSNKVNDSVKLVSQTVTDGTKMLEYYGATESTRIKTTTSGTAKAWWLRSAYYNNVNTFNIVKSNGDNNGSLATTTNGVAPAFRILE